MAKFRQGDLVLTSSQKIIQGSKIILDEDGSLTLSQGASIEEISNNAATDSTSALLTASAIHELNLNGTSGSGGSGSSGTSGSSGSSSIAGAFVHTQVLDSTSWLVIHNLGVKYVNVEVADSNDLSIVPESISFIDTTSLVITFTEEVSGHAAVTSGGGQAGTSGTSGYVDDNTLKQHFLL